MLDTIRDWFGFGGFDRHQAHGAHDHGESGGHGHTHGVIDPRIASSERGIWAIKLSFIILAITSALQLAVVYVTGSVALLADAISRHRRRNDRHPALVRVHPGAPEAL